MMDEDEKKLDKKARSEAQRLQSIREKAEAERKRQEAISAALQNVDKPANSKIVFDDSDDDDDDENAQPSTSNESGKASKSKVALFDSDEENEEGDDIILPNRHTGKKGEKLMHLESKFQNDDRFKMTDKFVSDDESEDEREIEKKKNRELLSKVLGKTVVAQQKTINTGGDTSKKIPPRPFTRFDPDNEEHVSWMNKYGGKKSDKEVEKDDEDNESSDSDSEDEKNEGIAGKFFEMDSNFADELKKRLQEGDDKVDDNGFSFLAMMGRKQENEVENTYEPAAKVLRLEPAKSKAAASLTSGSKPSNFFISAEEPIVVSLVANFKRTQSIDKMVGGWSLYRDAISKIYRHKRREALAKMKKGKDFLRKPQDRKEKRKVSEDAAVVAE